MLVPIIRLKRVAALSGLRAALSYARLPRYLLPRRSMNNAEGVTSLCSGLLCRRTLSPS